eukprot:CAMPEP_0185736960 /NCGR_PEP_ID=MMETSP1171-20130828/29313_1 /TAXON_ID=374046 /ORGANISM="Helicotheca tamensis, Strain CCMP826" /LENGTH=64 /DNA_ID=CAMNT_0028407741 /DNA_START=69 /DNA_END=260 /DNA_ORIENTATION=+
MIGDEKDDDEEDDDGDDDVGIIVGSGIIDCLLGPIPLQPHDSFNSFMYLCNSSSLLLLSFNTSS